MKALLVLLAVAIIG